MARFNWRILEPILAVALLATVGAIALRMCTRGTPFDKAQWHDTRSAEAIKLGMGRNLVANGALEGKSRDDVVALLGEPQEGLEATDWDLAYELAQGHGLARVEPAWLVVRLDAKDRVVESEIIRE